MTAGAPSPTSLNVLAGIAGEGGTPSLAWFAPVGSTAPTDASTALDAAYLTAGYCADTGATISSNINTTEIPAFGVQTPVRTLVTDGSKTIHLVFLETNVVTQAVKAQLPLSGANAPALTAATGALEYAEGPARSQEYALCLTATDGANVIRKFAPIVQVTGLDDETIAQNAGYSFGVTLTAYPDSSGNSLYNYFLVPNLATA